MSFKFLKNLTENIKKLDMEVNDYKRIVQNPSIPSVAYVNWAINLAETGSYQEAEDKLVSATLMAHQTPEAYINLGVLKIREKNHEEAINYYIKAIRLDNNNAKAYCFLANALTEVEKYEEAEKKFSHALKLQPSNSDILMNWGISLVRQKKFLKAKEKFEQACASNRANFPAIYFQGLVDLELGDIEKAKEKLTLITKAIPTHFEAWYYLAYIFFKEKNYEKCLEFAQKSLSIFNKKIETYMLIAESYMHLEDEANCFKIYAQGAKNCTISYYFLISWGMAQQRFKHYEESKDNFQKAIDIFPENDLGYSYMGTSLYRLNEYEKATESFNKSLEINSKNQVAMDSLGQMEFDRENYKGAIKYFSQILKNSAKAVENYAKIANAYFLDGNIPKANEFYKKALDYQPNEIKIYIDYAKILIEQKDYENAVKKLQNAYKLDNNNIECLNNLFYANYLLAKENISDYNMERAIEIAKKIEKNYPDSFVYIEEKNELEMCLLSKKKVD